MQARIGNPAALPPFKKGQHVTVAGLGSDQYQGVIVEVEPDGFFYTVGWTRPVKITIRREAVTLLAPIQEAGHEGV